MPDHPTMALVPVARGAAGPRVTAFKGALACGLTLAGLTMVQPALADLTLTVTDPMAPTFTGCNTTSTTGTLNATCSDSNFSSIIVNASGSTGSAPGLLDQPGLTSNQITVTSTAALGTRTLTIEVDQTGLTFLGGDVSATLGFNAFAAPTVPMTLQAEVNGTTLFEDTRATTTITETSTPVTLGSVTADSAVFSLTFSGPQQTTSATISINPPPPTPPTTPEPASLALLVTALAGFGFLGIHRRWVNAASGDDGEGRPV